MNKLLFKLLRYSGLPFLFRQLVQRNKVTILMFHDISAQTADRSFRYLTQAYNLISLDTYIRACRTRNAALIPPRAAVITFDDGHKRNYELVPVLEKYRVPATIFLCSGIVGTNRHYWFTRKHPDLDSSELKKVSNQEKLRILSRTGFEVDKDFETRQALSKAEIEEMKKYIDFQAHTVFHPCLPTCGDEESKMEIALSKQMLESDYALHVHALAYPNGDYGEREVRFSREAGYACAVTVDYGFNTLDSDLFRLKRLSVNDTDNMDELVVKASGVWGFFKNMAAKPKK
ncbi:MAG: polysaccharide deacetylase family protein [Lewinellaceae bacterium]|nr:polysaccharide deacetylase family protein [Lewinella sp.]MCB9280970.1 polysaccharide deacetylase family protein [Lewinellaceae bacterium]